MADPNHDQSPGEVFTPLTEEQVKQRRGRVLATAWALAVMAFLFMAVTYVRLGDRMIQRHKPAEQVQTGQGQIGQDRAGQDQAKQHPAAQQAAPQQKN